MAWHASWRACSAGGQRVWGPPVTQWWWAQWTSLPSVPPGERWMGKGEEEMEEGREDRERGQYRKV